MKGERGHKSEGKKKECGYIAVSLRKEEREAIRAEAERQGITAGALCAYFVRLHLKTYCKVTPTRAARKPKETD